ncbi:MAG: ABC transporter substrate-binding protein, partial [Chromatiales bacterium]
ACDQAQDNRVIRMGLASAPLNLDPRFATDATSARINRLLYQRLVEFDGQGMPVPGIADWQRLAPTHYRFRLLPQAGRFTDGAAVTAEDVVASYRFVLDPANLSPHRAALTMIERLVAIDRQTIDFHIDRPDPLFPAYLVLEILPARQIAAGHPFESSPLGSGEFRYLGRPEPGRLRLQRRRDGQRFELLEVKNPTVRVLKLLRGEILLLQNDLSPELIGFLRKREELTVNQLNGINFSYIGFNMQDAATSDPRVRRAIAHAIDRAAIIRFVLQRGARPAEALFPPEHWAGNPELTAIPYDPARARTLLAEAGYGLQRPLHLVYKSSSDPFRIRLATVIQGQLEAVGIDLELRSYDWGTFFGDIKAGRFQLYSLTWVGLRTPDSFRYLFDSDSLPPHGANRGRYVSEEVDRLLDRADAEQSLEERAASYRQIQQILHRDLPYVPLWYEDQLAVSRLEISGYTLQADGNYDGLKQVRFVEPRVSARELAHVAD